MSSRGWDEVSILETSNTNNQRTKEPKSFPNISGSDQKTWTKKRDSALFGCWKTKLFDVPRPHHPSPGCPKPAGHFSKEGVSVTGVFDHWQLGILETGRGLVPPDHKEYVRPRCCFWVRTRNILEYYSCLFDQTIQWFTSSRACHDLNKLTTYESVWNAKPAEWSSSRSWWTLPGSPFFCPYQFWLSNPWVSWCFEQNHNTTDLVMQIPVQC